MVNKIKFKGRTIYRKRLVDNILKVYNDPRAQISGDWYKDANQLCKDLGSHFEVAPEVVAGIIAALSPLKSWTQNQKIAFDFLLTDRAGHTAVMVDKARTILTADTANMRQFILDTLRGNKIKSFFINMAYPNEVDLVTIDRHALAIALGRNIEEREGVGITIAQYNFFQSCYIQAAKEINIRPNLIQSITWEKWRIIKKLK